MAVAVVVEAAPVASASVTSLPSTTITIWMKRSPMQSFSRLSPDQLEVEHESRSGRISPDEASYSMPKSCRCCDRTKAM